MFTVPAVKQVARSTFERSTGTRLRLSEASFWDCAVHGAQDRLRRRGSLASMRYRRALQTARRPVPDKRGRQEESRGPRIERIRHDLKRRSLQVESISRLTPGMLRITFSSEDLSGFISLAPDDHVKISVPTGSEEFERRDYTPRRYDPRTRTLAIDFVIHDAGPVTRWALDTRPGG
jgi:hypothetical protein